VYGPQMYIFKDILEERKKRALYLPVYPLPMDVSKKVKEGDIATLINPMANGEIYIHRSMKELIGEIVAYPGGMTMDLIDCLGKLCRYHWTRRPLVSIEGRYRDTGAGAAENTKNALTGY